MSASTGSGHSVNETSLTLGAFSAAKGPVLYK
jgi:hypothetical protein